MTVYERLAACGSEEYRDFQGRLVPSIPKEAINFPIEVALIFTVLKIIQKIKPMERQI